MNEITLESFAENRDATRTLSEELESRIVDYLDATRPHFRPSAVLGSHVSGSKDNAKTANTAFAQLTAIYKEAAASLKLDDTLSDPIELNSGAPAIFPLIYYRSLSTPAGTKRLTVTARFRWVLAFPAYPFQELFALAGSRAPKDKFRDFVLHYATLNAIVMQNKQLLALFEGLRFPIRSERLDGFEKLPITTISAPAGSLLPPDPLMAQISRLSGSDTAEEVADVDAWTQLRDPHAEWFQKRWAEILPR